MESEINTRLIKMLGAAVHELKQRARGKSLADFQRIFGFILGVRAVLQVLHGSYDFTHAKFVQKLLDDELAQKSFKEIKDYAFPLSEVEPLETSNKGGGL